MNLFKSIKSFFQSDYEDLHEIVNHYWITSFYSKGIKCPKCGGEPKREYIAKGKRINYNLNSVNLAGNYYFFVHHEHIVCRCRQCRFGWRELTDS